MKQLFSLIALFVIAALVIFITRIESPLKKNEPKIIEGAFGSTTLSLEIADNNISRARGLSDRANLEENHGMLFVFPKPQTPGFWMKDMKFPIDIIWLNENLNVIGVEKNVDPSTYPNAFYPPGPVKYVIEVPAGFSDQNNLEVGEALLLKSQNLLTNPQF